MPHTRAGWGVDLHGLVLAWAEAGRPQVAARPNVPVPWDTSPRPSVVRVPSGDGEPASFEEAVPIQAQPQPDLRPGGHWRGRLERRPARSGKGPRHPARSEPPSGGTRLTAWSDAAVHDRLVASERYMVITTVDCAEPTRGRAFAGNP